MATHDADCLCIDAPGSRQLREQLARSLRDRGCLIAVKQADGRCETRHVRQRRSDLQFAVVVAVEDYLSSIPRFPGAAIVQQLLVRRAIERCCSYEAACQGSE